VTIQVTKTVTKVHWEHEAWSADAAGRTPTVAPDASGNRGGLAAARAGPGESGRGAEKGRAADGSGSGRGARRALAAHGAVLRAKFPADGRRVRSWLNRPEGPLDALSFLPSVHAVGIRRDLAPVRRVNRPRSDADRA
jgi:hypothetical protein